jgi:hypothetical protein
MGRSDDGDAHACTSIGMSTDLGIGLLTFFSKQGGNKFLQQNSDFLPTVVVGDHPSVDNTTTNVEKCRCCLYLSVVEV